MKLVNSGNPLSLEALSKPKVETPTVFKILSNSVECILGMCCHRGRLVPCDAVIPHEKGVVIERGGRFLLNGVDEVTFATIPEAHEIELDEYALPFRKSNAISHPWGALIITEKKEYGASFCILVLPNH